MSADAGSIVKVAVAGATGTLGSVITQRLIDSGRFDVRILRRPGSQAAVPSSADVRDVDYASPDSLRAALAGVHAVVAPLGYAAIGLQAPLIDAAIDAGVSRFIPSEFGSDLQNPNTRALPIPLFAEKVRIADYLVAKAASTPLTYTFLNNGAFLDWGLQHNFLLDAQSYKPTIYDAGDTPFSATTLSSIADAVVGVLTHPRETKNRAVYVDDIKFTQNQLLAWAQHVAPEKPWDPQHARLDDVVRAAGERLAQGIVDLPTIVPYLFRAILDPAYGGCFQRTDNKLLGVKDKTEQDVKDMLKQVIHG